MLEEQMTQFTADFDRAQMGYSPDRVEALVWALTALIVQAQNPARAAYLGFMAR
jgi:phage terminase large subunit-like protein